MITDGSHPSHMDPDPAQTPSSTALQSTTQQPWERGLDVTRPVLAVLDGAKALVKGVRQVFDQPLIQRCIVHKLRNVLDYLPEGERSWVEAVCRRAWREPDAAKAERDLK